MLTGNLDTGRSNKESKNRTEKIDKEIENIYLYFPSPGSLTGSSPSPARVVIYWAVKSKYE